ncbi:ABC transporter substrate-binding protein [Micrococcales bacterium 31B]|nr:ABC transporter substrate-binding protein [Micrococcales bacterium 31B]
MPLAAHSTSIGAADSTTAEAGDNILKLATAATIDSFNPFTSVYLLPTSVNRYVYENLVQYDATDGSPTKGLADSWETSPDGKVWTFTLQSGLVWSDDQPITSADVKWTYDQMMTVPDMAAANGGLVEGFQSVEAPDAQTVVITLKEPQAANPGTEIPIVPKHVWEAISNPAEFANDKDVVGSGPYLLKSYSPNQSVELVANPKFWRGAPKLDGIRYTYYTNADAQLQALRAGDIDLVSGITDAQAKTIEGDSQFTVNRGEGRRFSGIGLNHGLQTPEGEAYGTGNPALKELPVREAIRLGIDIPTMMNSVIGGYGTVATSFIPSAYEKWHLPNDDSVLVKFDPAAAKAKLDAAGWAAGSDGIRTKAGQRLSLRLLIDADSPQNKAMSDLITGWMKDIGIEIKAESTDGDTLSDRTSTGDYDMYFTGWSENPDPDYQLGINLCSSRPNAQGEGPTSQDGFCDPAFDELYAQQHSELDEAKRIEMVREMQRIHYKAVPSITLWYAQTIEAYNNTRFKDFTLQPTDGGAITFQAGYWGYLTAAPVAAASATGAAAEDSGSNTALIAAIIGGVVVVGGGGALVAAKRKKSSDSRE